MKKLNMKQKQEIRNCKKVISNIKGWLQSNIDAELHEKDLVLDNKDLLFFIDKWEKLISKLSPKNMEWSEMSLYSKDIANLLS